MATAKRKMSEKEYVAAHRKELEKQGLVIDPKTGKVVDRIISETGYLRDYKKTATPKKKTAEKKKK